MTGKPIAQRGKGRHATFNKYENGAQQICNTYPKVLLFPSDADGTVVTESAKYRSSNRLPALTYYDQVSGTSIWRCS